MKLTLRFTYVLFHKPYGVLSQFTDSTGKQTLSDFGPFLKDVYPVGRLDADSEGLLFLTSNGKLKHLLLDPRFRHPRTYLAQVERIPSDDALDKLRHGLLIEAKKTRAAEVELLPNEPQLPPRPVPIRLRKNVPNVWLKLVLTEGRNRQVRKMTAAVGHPTLRLVRIAIGPLVLGDLAPGEKRELSSREVGDLMDFVRMPVR